MATPGTDFLGSLQNYGYQPENYGGMQLGGQVDTAVNMDSAKLSPYATKAVSPDYKLGDMAKWGEGSGKGPDWFGKDGMASPLIEGVTGAGKLYLGYQALQEQKKANQFSQGLARTNLANQASLTNQRLGDRFTARSNQAGTGEGTEGFANRLASYKRDNLVSGTV